jgi:ubiquinone/menaquinone biosynthesis C-methylase UbiE
MDCYKGFATVYDFFMVKDIPYDEWVDYIDKIITKSKLVLDMACGTGNMTLRLAKHGYDMIGLDASEDMLIQAQDKAYEQNHRILWLLQDMRELDLYGTVDAVTCVCDGLNYITDSDALKNVFKRVRLFLNPGGVFIFDMNTEYKFKDVLANGSFGDEVLEAQYQWDNDYNTATKINEYRLRVCAGGKNPTVFEEIHHQRAYDMGTVSNWLMEAGFASIQLRDNYSHQPPTFNTTRVTVICR